MKNGMILFALVCMLIGTGCSDDEIEYTSVEIRIENISDTEYFDVVVNGGGEAHNYGNVAQGIATDYQNYDYAYGYAGITLRANGENYQLQPIDFVGEAQLKPGRYTYELDIEPLETFNSIRLSLKED